MRPLITPRGCPSYSDGIHQLRDLGRSEMHAAKLRRCRCGVQRIYQTDETMHRRMLDQPLVKSLLADFIKIGDEFSTSRWQDAAMSLDDFRQTVLDLLDPVVVGVPDTYVTDVRYEDNAITATISIPESVARQLGLL